MKCLTKLPTAFENYTILGTLSSRELRGPHLYVVLECITLHQWSIQEHWLPTWNHYTQNQTWILHNIISMASCKTAVTPLLTHWSYCSLALSHRYHNHVLMSSKNPLICPLNKKKCYLHHIDILRAIKLKRFNMFSKCPQGQFAFSDYSIHPLQ